MAVVGIVMICFMSWTIIVAKNARKELLEGEQGNFELQGKGSCEVYQVQFLKIPQLFLQYFKG